MIGSFLLLQKFTQLFLSLSLLLFSEYMNSNPTACPNSFSERQIKSFTGPLYHKEKPSLNKLVFNLHIKTDA